MIRHPTETQLNRFADGVLRGDAHDEVAGHLAQCTRCRTTVSSIRELTHRARQLPPIHPPEGALGRIVRKRASGARVIWPAADPGPATPQRRLPGLLAAALAAIIVGGGSILLVGNVGATAALGELRFFPDTPTGSDTIRVEYESHPMFAGAPRLALRARFRTARYDPPLNSRTRHRVVATLHRGSDDRYTGEFILPDSVVYAAFAVEDTLGRAVDSNRRQLWELVVHTPLGVPSLEGLIQRLGDAFNRDPWKAYRTAREAVELYPESPKAWTYMAAADQWLGWDREDLDSALAFHRRQFGRLEGALARLAEPSADDLASMTSYANRLSHPALSRWKTRLYRDAPRHPVAVQFKALDILGASLPDPLRLERLDALWREFGGLHEQTARAGYVVARRIGDPETILTWANRLDAPLRFSSLTELMADPGTRAGAIEFARRELAAFDASRPDRRLLFRNRRAQRVADDYTKRVPLAGLGRALIAAGDVRAGLDALELATASGWSLPVFRQMAETKTRLADTAGALEALANIAVAPEAEAATVDSVTDMAATLLGERDWDDLLNRARERMVERTLLTQQVQPIPNDVRLVGPAGERTTLFRLLGDDPVSVLSFWSAPRPDAPSALPQLRRVVDRLSRGSVRVAVVVEPVPTGVGARLLRLLDEHGLTPNVYRVAGGNIRRALATRTFVTHYVVDGNRRIRFVDWDLDEIVRQVAVLKMTQPIAGVVE